MRNYLLVGLGVAGLGAAGWLYYSHVPKVPPAPKDLTKVLPKQLLDKASPQQLAVLRGEAASAPKIVGSAAGTIPTPAAPGAAATSPQGDTLALPAGLTATLTNSKENSLKGQAVNSGEAAAVYAYPAGTLFSNGKGDVILLKDVSVEVPPKASADLVLPMAQMSAEAGMLEGNFTPRQGSADALQPLLSLLSHRKAVPAAIVQTAVLIINEDVPLDVVASFPRMRPIALVETGAQPFSTSPADLIAALSLIQEAGIDPAKTAMMSEPQLEVMTMLNPDSHVAARDFFGITDQTEWAFWKRQLTEGDPALRHFALYGIARYYPDVALQMLPRWVRADNIYRNYRLSAAWALALIDDSRAQTELKALRQELQKDAGMRQAIDRALQHWVSGNEKIASNHAG